MAIPEGSRWNSKFWCPSNPIPVGSNPIPVGSNPIPVGSDPIPGDFNPKIQPQFQKVPGGIPNFGVPQTQPQLVPTQPQLDPTQFPATPPQIPPFPDSRPPEPPEVAVFPKHPVEDEEPNILICSVTKFWPAALGVTWLRNGAPVTRGVLETPFYPDRDFTFRKFSYLPFVPAPGDYYDCQVEHEGLAKPAKMHWEPQILAPASEATETAICALGLAVGIVGITAGTILIIRGMKLGRARPERGVL
uniref:Ig-like domain-containing protein n=1 Tax=Taeniopygia guttata TaxID=59729 RepID=A0A674GIQ3_TAEGU